jgi:hypothetical protein
MIFRFTHMSQTQLGKLFGVTSHAIGEWLRSLGLRAEDGTPTRKAKEGHFCKQTVAGEKGTLWVWNSETTVAALIKAGHLLLLNPPQNLVAPANLNGPFRLRNQPSSEFVIENGDGSVSIWANNRMTADVIARILNAAHKSGFLDRLCSPQKLLQTPLAPSEEVDSVVTPFE